MRSTFPHTPAHNNPWGLLFTRVHPGAATWKRDETLLKRAIRRVETCEQSMESGTGLPHSKTLREVGGRTMFRQVLECGSPVPLFPETEDAIGALNGAPTRMWSRQSGRSLLRPGTGALGCSCLLGFGSKLGIWRRVASSPQPSPPLDERRPFVATSPTVSAS